MKMGATAGSALALMFSTSAFAQSAVTLYGIIDEGLNYTNNVGGHSLIELATGYAQGSHWGLKGPAARRRPASLTPIRT